MLYVHTAPLLIKEKEREIERELRKVRLSTISLFLSYSERLSDFVISAKVPKLHISKAAEVNIMSVIRVVSQKYEIMN